MTKKVEPADMESHRTPLIAQIAIGITFCLLQIVTPAYGTESAYISSDGRRGGPVAARLAWGWVLRSFPAGEEKVENSRPRVLHS